MPNVSQKGLQRPFWLSLHYVAEPSRFWVAFYSFFATAVANTSSARARTKKSTQKCQKSRFCDFCTKNRTFFTENRCKSTQLVATG